MTAAFDPGVMTEPDAAPLLVAGGRGFHWLTRCGTLLAVGCAQSRAA